MKIVKKLNPEFFESIRRIFCDARQKVYSSVNFRQVYLTYPDFGKCYELCSKFTWSPHQQELEARHILKALTSEGGNHE